MRLGRDSGQACNPGPGATACDSGQACNPGPGATACDSGQGTAELAVVLPVVVIAMLSVVQVGLIGRDQLLVWHAAREAARAAAVEPTPAVARSAALGAVSALEPGRLTVTTNGGTVTGELITASLQYRAPTAVPLVGRMIGDIEMSAEVTMRIE